PSTSAPAPAVRTERPRWSGRSHFLPGHPVRTVGRRSRSEEHTSELQSRENLVCRLLLEKKKRSTNNNMLHDFNMSTRKIAQLCDGQPDCYLLHQGDAQDIQRPMCVPQCHRHPRGLHSFPTRRSSDLTEYLCAGASGADGKTTLVRAEPLPPGSPCAHGGQAIIVGVDEDRDGALSEAEVQTTTQICNGAPGADGQNGRSSLVVTSAATGAQCPDGGTAISSGVDDNGNGTLDAEEVDATEVVCRETCSISEAEAGPTMTCTDGSSLRLSAGGCSAGPGAVSGLWFLGLVAVPVLRRRRQARTGVRARAAAGPLRGENRRGLVPADRGFTWCRVRGMR